MNTTHSNNRIGAALARRVASTWAAYEAARASHGTAAALPILRRWHVLRAALACHLTGAELLVILPAPAETLPLASAASIAPPRRPRPISRPWRASRSLRRGQLQHAAGGWKGGAR